MTNRKRNFSLFIVCLAAIIGFASCRTIETLAILPEYADVGDYYRVQDLTPVMVAQIGSIAFYVPGPGEQVNSIYIPRDLSGSPLADISNYEGGEWYSTRHGRIVSVETFTRRTIFYREYVLTTELDSTARVGVAFHRGFTRYLYNSYLEKGDRDRLIHRRTWQWGYWPERDAEVPRSAPFDNEIPILYEYFWRVEYVD